MKLPDYPDNSQPMSKAWLCEWLKDATDYLRAVTVTGGVGYNATVSHAGTSLVIDKARGGGGGSHGDEIFYGHPTSAWSSGATITLTPCDLAGTATGASNQTVKLLASGSSYSIVNYDAGGGSAATGCTIPTTAIVAYTVIGDGTAYVVGEPAVVFPSPTDAFFRSISGKLQMRVRFQIGGALSTLSNWLDMIQSTPSKETACTAPGS